MGKDGIEVDSAKIEPLMKWIMPRDLANCAHFWSYVSISNVFIQRYSTLVVPITKLTRHGFNYHWTVEC